MIVRARAPLRLGLAGGGTTEPVSGRLDGVSIEFTAGGRRYAGQVAGDRMSGSFEGGGRWTATRTSP